ncbi:immunoglobulin superfamily, member 3-like [Pseudorasbora parva]|uniref:immunoglobulin superfamily, member 3-like n=1 Tax=Pseudorasbora parva TaxID=51549 RepID=UPI00351E3A49
MRGRGKASVRLRMEGFWCRLWHLQLLLCLTGLLQGDLCYGQRLVQIQEGPLYRVKGYPISISCTVTGFKGPSEQNFEFILRKPNVDLNMISTTNQKFAYTEFSRRVNEKEIEIERLSGSSVLLRINNLLGEDAGDLFCQTPNTDGEYLGSYEAGSTLNVIEDTLEASYFGSPSQSLTEGDPLQLECQVSSQTYQHTHLSVTWFVHSGAHEDPRPIITLDKDLTVKTGAGFEDRYHSGLISMDKVEDTTYRLKMSQVQLSDQGKIYCKAMEWIQDPDRSWTPIAHKTSTACNVEVKQIVASAVGSFSVYMKPSKGTLQVGDALDIHCSVKAQNLPGHLFSVTWLKNQKTVAQIGSSGMLTVFDSYKDRENLAEMRAVKISLTDYLLTIRSARTEDQGQYQCEVWQENMNDDGTFRKIQKQLSSPETVSVTAKESDLTVVMEMKDAVTEGDPLQVTCSVSGFKGPLSVSWQHKKDSGDSFSDVISLTNEGVMKDIGTKYQSRHVQTLHSPAGNFTLEIGASARSDSGEYRCIVSEWTVQSNGEMKKANTQTQQKSITVNSVESLMTVTLKSRTTNVVINSSVELLCTVKGPKVSLAVHWMFRPPNSTVPRNILTIRHTGEIAWGADQRTSYQLSIQTQLSATQFRLIVPRASKQQEGQYQCQVDAYQKNVQKAMKSSNPLAVTVQKPVSKMSLSKLKSRLETTVNTDVKIECSVLATTTDTSRFTITWMIGSQMLLTMDLDAVLKFGPAGLEMDQRIRMEVRQKQIFQLTVHQVQTTDNGQYHCEVEEWLQDPLGDWYSLKKMSVSTELVVNERESKLDVKKENKMLNITTHEAGFTVDCLIDSQSSDKSAFEVTWFKVQEEEEPVALFTARRDGILHSSISDKSLVFGRPLATHYKLTVPQINPTDVGQYYCQVEEWLPTANNWKKLASDKSGELTVYVHTEGDPVQSIDWLLITLAVTVPLISFLVVVIILLLTRKHKRKKKACLWTEDYPLNRVPKGTSVRSI